MSSELFLRLYVEATSPDQAETILASALSDLQSKATLTKTEIESYWKVPEWQEVKLTLTLADNADLLSILKSLSEGWTLNFLEDSTEAITYESGKKHHAIQWAIAQVFKTSL